MAIAQHPADPAFADRIYCLGLVTASVVVGLAVYQNSAAADFSAAPLADFVDSVVAGYSSPAADPGFASDCFAIVDSAVAGFAADCFVIAAAAVVVVVVVVVAAAAADLSAPGLCLSSDLFCSADFVAAGVAAVWDASSVAQSLP